MTTRRRRTGSESNPLETPSETVHQESNPSNSINPFSIPVPGKPVPPNSQQQGLYWSGSANNNSSESAFYKKTDQNFNHKNSTVNIFTPSSGSNCNTNSQPGNPSHSSQPSKFTDFSQGLSNCINNFITSDLNGVEEESEGSPGFRYSNKFDASEMACRDRTTEFASIIRSQQQGHLSNGVAGRGRGVNNRNPNKGVQDLAQYSNFMKRSKMVGQNISSTYAKLEKLTYLARKRSLFDDSQDTEVQELTAIIRHDLGSLTKQLDDLRKCCLPNSSSNASTSHIHKHSANVVGSLQTKVANITHKFRDVLEVRTENLKQQAARREQFTGASNTDMAISQHNPGMSVLLADEAQATNRRGGAVVLDFEGMSPSSHNTNPHQNQLMLMEEQDSLLTARAETMKTIESTIVELGTMFQQLATMVTEQDELVHRIDANVDDAEMNVEAAHTQLLQYFKSVSSNRWLMFKVFGIVIVFFIIFVVFMA